MEGRVTYDIVRNMPGVPVGGGAVLVGGGREDRTNISAGFAFKMVLLSGRKERPPNVGNMPGVPIGGG